MAIFMKRRAEFALRRAAFTLFTLLARPALIILTAPLGV